MSGFLAFPCSSVSTTVKSSQSSFQRTYTSFFRYCLIFKDHFKSLKSATFILYHTISPLSRTFLKFLKKISNRVFGAPTTPTGGLSVYHTCYPLSIPFYNKKVQKNPPLKGEFFVDSFYFNLKYIL